MLHVRLAGTAYTSIVLLQLLQNIVGTVHYAARHSGNLCHMNTEGVLAATRFQLAQEDNLAIHLLHTHVEVLDAREILLHLVQLVIMSGKEGASLRLLVLMQIFHDSPGDGNAIVGGCSTTQLIEKYQRAGRHIVQNVGSLRHLHHKGRFTQRDVVAGSHTGEDLIYQTYPCTLGRNKAAHLSQQHDERRLAEQG